MPFFPIDSRNKPKLDVAAAVIFAVQCMLIQLPLVLVYWLLTGNPAGEALIGLLRQSLGLADDDPFSFQRRFKRDDVVASGSALLVPIATGLLALSHGLRDGTRSWAGAWKQALAYSLLKVPLFSLGAVLLFTLLASLFGLGGVDGKWGALPHIGVGILALVLTRTLRSTINELRRPSGTNTIRGKTLLPAGSVAALIRKASRSKHSNSEGSAGLAWAGHQFDSGQLDVHFSVCGTTGAGKTLLMRTLMASVLTQAGHSAPRALIFDPKNDAYPWLVELGVPLERVAILNPYDQRCVAWDIAADVQTEDDAFEVASILCPQDEDAKEPFFRDAAALLLSEVMIALRAACGTHWDLNDVLEVMSERARMTALLRSTSSGRELLDQFFRAESKATDSVLMTYATKSRRLRTPARLWKRATRRVSLRKEWGRGDGILLLGYSLRHREVLGALNRVLLHFAASVAASQDTGAGESWFSVDEFRTLGRLDGVDDLLNYGRDFGVRVILGFQDIEGLKGLYGESKARELIDLCGNQAILRVSSEATAKWASERFGKYEYWQRSYSDTRSGMGDSATETRSITQREAVLPSEFMQFDPAGEDVGVPGGFIVPSVGAWVDPAPWTFTEPARMKARSADGFVPQADDASERIELNATDLERLGLSTPSAPELRSLD